MYDDQGNDFHRTRWADGAEIGTGISPWQPYGGIDEYGNLIDWTDQFQARDLADMLRRDGKARSLESVITLPIRAEAVNITPAAGDRGECEWLLGMLDRMDQPLQHIVDLGVQSLIYRTTFLEKVFDHRDGRMVYDRLAWRPNDACSMIHDKDTGRLLGFQQSLGGPDRFGMVEIPLRKAVVFLHGAYRDPIRGASELEICYRCYQDKQKVRYLWSSFLAGAAVPRTIAETEPGTEASVVAALRKLANGGTAAVPTGTKVTPLNVAGSAGPEFLSMMTYLDAEMSGSVLAGFTELSSAAGRGSRGSMALAQSETTFFANSLDAHAKEIAHTLRAQAFAPLLRVNFGADCAVPKVVIGPVSTLAVQDALTALATMAAAHTDQSIVPAEFVDELTVKVAGMLDLDPKKISDAIAARTAQVEATQPAAGVNTGRLHAAVGVTSGAVRRAQSGLDPLPAAA